MIKKSVILSLVLFLLALSSYVHAEDKGCCLSHLYDRCIYGSILIGDDENDPDDVIVMNAQNCAEIDGTFIGTFDSRATCNSQSDCLRDCCCVEEVEGSGISVGHYIPRDICEVEYQGVFNSGQGQENCQSFCDAPNCGNDICESDETIQDCPQDCSQVITPPGEEPGEEVMPECTVNANCANKCVGSTFQSNGRCVDGTCQYDSEENCGDTDKICTSSGCIEGVDCSECNVPLGLFGMVTDTCNQNPYALACYFDYTSTIVDAHKECENVDTCYDYKSAESCSKNNCLQGNCVWNNNQAYRYGDLGIGVCRPETVNQQECGRCKTDILNSVFDVCDENRCRLFGQCSLNSIGNCVGDIHDSPTLDNLEIKEVIDPTTKTDITDKIGVNEGAEYGNDIKFGVDAQAAAGHDIKQVDLNIYQCDADGEHCQITESGSGVTGSVVRNMITGMATEGYCGDGTIDTELGEQCDCGNDDQCNEEEINEFVINGQIMNECPLLRPGTIGKPSCYIPSRSFPCKINAEACSDSSRRCNGDEQCVVDGCPGKISCDNGVLMDDCIKDDPNCQIDSGEDDQTGTDGTGDVIPPLTITSTATHPDIYNIGGNTYSIIIKNAADKCKLTPGVYKAGFIAYDNLGLGGRDDALFKIKLTESLKLITERVGTQTPEIWIWLDRQETGKCTIKYTPDTFISERESEFNPSIEDGCGFRKASLNIEEDYRLGEGDNSVKISCVLEGQTETITKIITVDLISPEISLDLANSQITDDVAYLTTGNTHLKISSDEELSECKYTYSTIELTDVQDSDLQYDIIEGYGSSNGNFIYDGYSLNLANGIYYFYAKCKDEVENPSEIKTLVANVNIEVGSDTPTLTITLLEPNAGYSTTVPYHVKISTDKQIQCRYMYSTTEISSPSYNSLPNQFTTTNLIHTTPDDIDGTINYIYISCMDTTTSPNTENKIRFSIGYDTSKPIINKLETELPQNEIIEEINGVLQKKVFVGTDKETICRYDKTTNVFDDMQGNFTDEEVDDYTTEQNKDIQDSSFTQGASVTFNVVCKARNGLTSDPSQITISVDLTKGLEITDNYPKGYVGEDETKLRVSTNKHADCRFYKSTTDYGTTINEKLNHESDLITGLTDGSQEFDVECTKDQESVNGKITFTVDTSPPSTPSVTAESYCYRKNGERCKIIATWSSSDDDSGIYRYKYYVANKTTNEVLFEAYTDEEESEELDFDDLNLESKFADEDEFKFLVSAENNAGLLSNNGTDIAEVDYSIIKDDNRAPSVKVKFNDDGDLVLECEDNVDDECDVLKYYLSNNGCPEEEDDYDNYNNPISVNSESITRLCYIARDSAGNENKGSRKLTDIVPDEEKDTDGDSIPDSWENKYFCVDKNKDDALVDYDEDGLTNKEEYYFGTDPCDEDTDNDGILDGKEIDDGTDPLIPNEYPTTVTDSDNDGMPDSWEDRYDCVDKNKRDENSDPDNDGLINIQEYKHRTNPCDPDSDDDGYTDSVEIEKGTNPLDAEDYPKSRWWLWTIIIILVLGGLGAASYFGYKEYTKTIEKPVIRKPIRKAPILIGRGKEKKLMKKREEKKEERRNKLFDAFVPGRKEGKIEKIKQKKHEIDIFERIPKIVQEDILKKLIKTWTVQAKL